MPMLRHKGTPARTRAGFARYIKIGTPGFMVDHVVVEYWDGSRWKLVNPEQNETLIRENGIDFDVQDIARDQFVVGGLAWSRCRKGQEDPINYGVQPGAGAKAGYPLKANRPISVDVGRFLKFNFWFDANIFKELSCHQVDDSDYTVSRHRNLRK